jgi:hypothetical protein
LLGSATAAADGTFSIQPSDQLPVGTNSLQTRARDLAGNVGNSLVLPLRINPLAAADYDGDGATDLGVYGFVASANSGRFLIDRTNGPDINQPFGGSGDFPMTGDYDGDGITDLGTYGYSPAEGFARFAIILSTGGTLSRPFGGANDIPMAGDYDGDGKTDLAVYGFSPANGFTRFAVLLSGGGNITLPFGGPDDVPMAGDYDGDGKADLGVYGFSPANGFSRFAVILSNGPNTQYPAGNITQPFGGLADVPVVGDYDGDGKTDLGVYGFSPANGFSRFAVILSNGPSTQNPAGNITLPFGGQGDLPVGGDYDGDGKTDPAVYGFSTADNLARFAILPSGGGAALNRPFGTQGDIGLPPSSALFVGVGRGAGPVSLPNSSPISDQAVSLSSAFGLNPASDSTIRLSSLTDSAATTNSASGTPNLGSQAAQLANPSRRASSKLDANNRRAVQQAAKRKAPSVAPTSSAEATHDQRDDALASAINRLGKFHASRLRNRPR